MLRVSAHDPELRRRGQILAIVILAMAASTAALSGVNLLHEQYQYNVSNAVFLTCILGLFVVNRLGYVVAACILTVTLIVVGSSVFLSGEDLAQTFIVMCIPVFIASFLLVPWSGIVVAAVVVFNALVFDDAPVNTISLLTFAALTAIVYLLARSLDRVNRQNRHRALYDSLTGLPNRALFLDQLKQAVDRFKSDRVPRALLFIDLDEFKVINDSLGHKMGDELLVVAARRLQTCLRPEDTAARLGGDEFTVLLDSVADAGDAIQAAQRIVKTLSAPIKLGERQIFLRTSVGIALCQDANSGPDVLLRNADAAMYEAKREGKARCKVFNTDMYVQALRRLELENGLRQAIEREEFRIYYQPKVLLDTGTIIGMEALVRWDHPGLGLIGPEEFIPLAEETGLIVPLGRWLLRESCSEARRWQELYPAAPSLSTSVNLSMRQFQDSDLVGEIAGILHQTGLDPRCLELEITESIVMDDVEYAIGIVERLRKLGISFAIDDFGTGHSSLASLRRFPLDTLKIDKEFIDGVGKDDQDTAIVQLVIDLGHAVGIQAVAEGVETAEQLTQLRNMGCDQAQGYYFWEPLAAGDAAALHAGSLPWLLNQSPSTEHYRNLEVSRRGRGNPQPS
jgi:diguanylate cyclase (GGDEF)-like protein